ncbi:MAG: hypothetical protein ACIWVG_20385 [Gloeotrichia echinulata HAB0833]
MKTFTLQQLFGENASQSASTLTISKLDLAAVGLTPAANNTAESLLAAMILNLLKEFEGEVFDLVDSNGGKITYLSGDIFENLHCFYWRNIKGKDGYIKDQIVINQYKLYEQAD